MPSRPWTCPVLDCGWAWLPRALCSITTEPRGQAGGSLCRTLPLLTQLNYLQGWSWKAKALDTVEECLPSYRYSLFGVSLLFAGMSLSSLHTKGRSILLKAPQPKKKGIISISNALPACTCTHTGESTTPAAKPVLWNCPGVARILPLSSSFQIGCTVTWSSAKLSYFFNVQNLKLRKKIKTESQGQTINHLLLLIYLVVCFHSK